MQKTAAEYCDHYTHNHWNRNGPLLQIFLYFFVLPSPRCLDETVLPYTHGFSQKNLQRNPFREIGFAQPPPLHTSSPRGERRAGGGEKIKTKIPRLKRSTVLMRATKVFPSHCIRYTYTSLSSSVGPERRKKFSPLKSCTTAALTREDFSNGFSSFFHAQCKRRNVLKKDRAYYF